MKASSYPVQSDFLKVSKLHSLYYEVWGNPKADPILFLHGGPGAGFTDQDKRFFDFDKHLVIFFDQRGASRSTPFACIEENTTQDLVKDINKLLDHLKVQKVLIFGGSWGTTLGMVYAIQFPERIKGLLLRGVFLNDKESSEHYLNGGVAKIYPEVWNRFKQHVPSDSPLSIIEYYFDKIKNGTPQERQFFAYEWAFYEISIYKKHITPIQVAQILAQIPYQSLAIMEMHYLSNGCFLEENYILNNLDKLQALTIKMVHGVSDAICPAKVVIQLDSLLTNSELFLVEGGHSDSEVQIEEKLIEILEIDHW